MKHDIDLSGLDKEQLEKLRDDVEKQIANVDRRRKKDALAAAREVALKHGFRLEDLLDATPAKKRGKPVPKFQDPDNPDQTWSGMGRQPKWFRDKMDAGTDRETLRIK